jgi:hypothetical protein
MILNKYNIILDEQSKMKKKKEKRKKEKGIQ